MKNDLQFAASRRGFLGLFAGGLATAAAVKPAKAAMVQTQARIVIIGAGAAGTALVNRLVERLDGAQITILDPRAEHWYQPGLSLKCQYIVKRRDGAGVIFQTNFC